MVIYGAGIDEVTGKFISCDGETATVHQPPSREWEEVPIADVMENLKRVTWDHPWCADPFPDEMGWCITDESGDHDFSTCEQFTEYLNTRH